MTLPDDIQVLERGWLSANNILLRDPAGATLVDSGYVAHAPQTLALLQQALQGQPLARLVNTHLHSDHCGGNAALQAHYPHLQVLIPPGEAAAVRAWDEAALSYRATGQRCDRFTFDEVLQPGQVLHAGRHAWQVHAAPGHDPHSLMLFEPQLRVLISADALWANGFGVVFPEIEGARAFDDVAATLDVIERLQPALVIPGHGAPFTDVAAALAVARRRLAQFVADPVRHARYAAKVLLKFKLLEWQQVPLAELQTWLAATPYFGLLRQQHFADTPPAAWADEVLAELVQNKTARLQEQGGQPWVFNEP